MLKKFNVTVTFFHRKTMNYQRECSFDVVSILQKFLRFFFSFFRPQLNEENLSKHTRESNMNNIIDLNVSCCNLKSIKMISQLKNLRTLNLSFNDLIQLDDLSYLYHLESIDLSYNKIHTFEGIKGLPKLTVLIATNNELTNSLNEILTLKRYCPALLHVDLRENPLDKVKMKKTNIDEKRFNLTFLQSETYRSRTLALFPTLASIDGINVTPYERSHAQKCQTEYCSSLVMRKSFELKSRLTFFCLFLVDLGISRCTLSNTSVSSP